MTNEQKCIQSGLHADCGACPHCHYCGILLTKLCKEVEGCAKQNNHEGEHRTRKDVMAERA